MQSYTKLLLCAADNLNSPWTRIFTCSECSFRSIHRSTCLSSSGYWSLSSISDLWSRNFRLTCERFPTRSGFLLLSGSWICSWWLRTSSWGLRWFRWGGWFLCLFGWFGRWSFLLLFAWSRSSYLSSVRAFLSLISIILGAGFLGCIDASFIGAGLLMILIYRFK